MPIFPLPCESLSRFRNAPRPSTTEVDVTADGERHDAGVECDPRGVEAHVAAAPDVDAHATRHGLEDQRMHLALARHERAGMLRERMSPGSRSGSASSMTLSGSIAVPFSSAQRRPMCT